MTNRESNDQEETAMRSGNERETYAVPRSNVSDRLKAEMDLLNALHAETENTIGDSSLDEDDGGFGGGFFDDSNVEKQFEQQKHSLGAATGRLAAALAERKKDQETSNPNALKASDTKKSVIPKVSDKANTTRADSTSESLPGDEIPRSRLAAALAERRDSRSKGETPSPIPVSVQQISNGDKRVEKKPKIDARDSNELPPYKKAPGSGSRLAAALAERNKQVETDFQVSQDVKIVSDGKAKPATSLNEDKNTNIQVAQTDGNRLATALDKNFQSDTDNTSHQTAPSNSAQLIEEENKSLSFSHDGPESKAHISVTRMKFDPFAETRKQSEEAEFATTESYAEKIKRDDRFEPGNLPQPDNELPESPPRQLLGRLKAALEEQGKQVDVDSATPEIAAKTPKVLDQPSEVLGNQDKDNAPSQTLAGLLQQKISEKNEGFETRIQPEVQIETAPSEREQEAKPETDQTFASRSLDSSQRRFLAHSDYLEETGAPIAFRLACWTLFGFLTFAIILSVFTTVDEAAVATGQVLPGGAIQKVQHLEGGILQSLEANEGDIVKKGQVLAVLKSATVRSEQLKLSIRRDQLDMQIERLKSLIEDRRPDFSRFAENYPTEVSEQLQLYQKEFDAFVIRKERTLKQIENRQKELEHLRLQHSYISESLKLIMTNVKNQERLYKKGFTTKRAFNDVKGQAAQTRAEAAEISASIARNLEFIEDMRGELDTSQSDFIANTITRIDELQLERVQVRENLVSINDRAQRLQVVAPVNGIVQNIPIQTVGGVIEAGGIIYEIVPLDEQMVLEVKISPDDIGRLELGTGAKISITAYDPTRYGYLDAVLTYISPHTFLETDGQPYYKATLEPQQSYLQSGNIKHDILPGMTLIAKINTGEKTIFEYMLSPIYRGLTNSFEEQ